MSDDTPTDSDKKTGPQLVRGLPDAPEQQSSNESSDEVGPPMSSRSPYMVRALYEWIVDNKLTPYLVVAATDERVMVPPQYVKDGHILLNIAPHSVQHLSLGNDEVRFHARFSGVSREVRAPIWALRAIYARENGEGMVFAEESGPTTVEAQPEQPPDDEPPKRARPTLRVVK